MAYTLPLSFSDAQTELATLTSQTGNFTFNSDELIQALKLAWNDTYVVKTVTDETVSFVAGTYSYPIPSTITAVSDIYFRRSTSDFPERISPDLYEIQGSNIVFLEYAQNWLDDTYTLIIKGRYKLTTNDSLPDATVANYVLYLAAERLLNALLLKKTFVFLTNDTSVGEIVTALRTFGSYVLTYKQGILRQWESS